MQDRKDNLNMLREHSVTTQLKKAPEKKTQYSQDDIQRSKFPKNSLIEKINLQKIDSKLKQRALEYLKVKTPELRDDFEKWLRLRSVQNMEKVCYSFYCNRLHYASSALSHKHDSVLKKDHFNTSMISLDSVFEVDEMKNEVKALSCYRVKKGFSAAKVLKELLYSHTSTDCTAAIVIAFNLTLYDVLDLLYGEDAPQKFDLLFGSHRPLKERFTFGSLSLGFKELSSTLEYFGTNIPKVNIDLLNKDPEKYIGSGFYIKGNEQYLLKHPSEDSQGWNVVFCGHNTKGEPLFLGAMGSLENYCLTYEEYIKLLTYNYNQFPSPPTRMHAKLTTTNESIHGFVEDYGQEFNIPKLLELTNIDELSKKLHQFMSDTLEQTKTQQIEETELLKLLKILKKRLKKSSLIKYFLLHH